MREWRGVLVVVGIVGVLMLLAALLPIPAHAQSAVPATPSSSGLSPKVVADDVVRPSIPCLVLADYAKLRGKVPVTDGIGRLYAASLTLHARLEKSKVLTRMMFLQATADVLACMDFGK